MSAEPHVVITRDKTGNVTAHGGDELAATLLKRAGFVTETSPRSLWYRLPWDLGERRENEMASRAARMLEAVGYRVDIGSDLLVGEVTTPSDPRGVHVHGHQILQLTDELNGVQSHDGAAELIEHVADPTDGVVIRLSEFFEAAAEQAKNAGTEAGWNLSYAFEDAAATLISLSDELESTADAFRALGRTPPSRQAQAAQQHSAAARVRNLPSASGTETASVAQPVVPDPRRRR
ncbi:hypothetical protein [Streptomyces sp. Da 82-17]|uniref:hypothetical protein n=1 Tax=Streptomyces sp. Da 82-17 TaxID=3377116 RepID=UPI0038D36D82